MTKDQLTRYLGIFLLGAFAAYAIVAGVDPESHPTCQTTMPVLNGKVRHGQPLTEREEKWWRECRGEN